MTVTTPSVNQFLGAERHQRSLENVRREFNPLYSNTQQYSFNHHNLIMCQHRSTQQEEVCLLSADISRTFCETMAVELVGKRCLCVSGEESLELAGISRWSWRAGVIRATTDSPALTVKLTSRLSFRKTFKHTLHFKPFSVDITSTNCLLLVCQKKSLTELLI